MLPAEKVVNDLRTFDAHGTPALTVYLATDPARDTSPLVQLVMSATSPADALSRVLRTPAMLWRADQAVALAPGATA